MPNDKAPGTNETAMTLEQEARELAMAAFAEHIRRRTLEEVIAKLRTKANAWGANCDHDIESVVDSLADELESELKAGEDRQ